MRRTGTVVLLVAVVVLAGTPLPAAGATTAALDAPTAWDQTGTTTAPGPSNGSSASAPGTRLAGAVGVQGAELGGELEARSLTHQLNRSETADSRAAVISQQAAQSRSRLTTLRAASERLEAARANGTVSEAEYRVRAAQLSAQTVAVRRVTERSATAAQELPDEALRRNGVNVTTLQSLQRDAGELVGPAMSAAAREVAGPRVGSGFGPNRAGGRERGPPSDPGGTPPDRARDGGPDTGQRPVDDPGNDTAASGGGQSPNDDPGNSGNSGNAGNPQSGNATDEGAGSQPNGPNGSDRSDGSSGSDQSGGSNGPGQSDGRNEEGNGRDNGEGRGNQS
jgi:hypothetical protein